MIKKSSRRSFAVRVVTLLAIGVMLSASLWAQAISGDIVGTVTDATKAVVPNVTVTAENTQTGVKTGSKSNSSGDYRFSDLPVGVYTVTATAAGFGTTSVHDVTVKLNQTITANITLELGVASTTIDVVVSGVTIDTTTPQIQSTYTQTQITDLPLASTGQPGLNFGALNLSLLSGNSRRGN